MLENIKNQNETLVELIIGILLTGLIGQIVCLFFRGRIVFLSVGWWTGIGAAIFMAVHIYRNISTAVEMSEKDATAMFRNKVMFRYAVVLILMALVYLSKLGNPVAYVLGALGLKVAAYSQPLIHRIYQKFTRR